MAGNFSLRYDPTASPGLAATTVIPVLDVAPPATTGFHETSGAAVTFATVSQLATLLDAHAGPITTASVTITQGTITALATGLGHTVTWNNAGVTFTAQTLAVTDTASNAASLLANWTVGGTTKFSVRKDGTVTLGANLNMTSGSLTVAAAGALQFSTRSVLSSTVDGSLTLTNTAASGFTALLRGPSASANSIYELQKQVTAIPDNTATAVLTVTVPNSVQAASLRVVLKGSLGAGGAIGADEASATISYDFAIARTAGVNAVTVASSAYGSATASVAGAATCTITAAASAIAGAVGATNTFTVQVTIARGSGSSDNHTCMVLAELRNGRASGVTIA